MTPRARLFATLCLALAWWPAAAQLSDRPIADDSSGDPRLVADLGAARDAIASAADEREALFRTKRDAARAALDRNRGVLDSLQRRHRRLLDALDAGEARRQNLEARLASGAEDERDLYDAARLSARDVRARLAGSLLNAQLPTRLDDLASMGRGSGPVAPEQIESLWLILLEDLTRSGQVARFEATVEGTRAPLSGTVTRIGTFAAYGPSGTGAGWDAVSATLREARRPGDSPNFDGRLAEVVIDPFDGSLTLLEAMRPGPAELVDQGGWIARIILALGALGVIVALVRFAVLLRVPETAARAGPMQRLDAIYRRTTEHPTSDMVAALADRVADEAGGLEKGQPLLKLLAALCPLLGLLGTVTAMIGMFRTIAIAGTGDPSLTAGSVAQALVTTLLGIGAAVVLILCHALVAGRSRRLVDTLDERAAGLVARHKAVRVTTRTTGR